MNPILFLTGPPSSGKSRLAHQIAHNSKLFLMRENDFGSQFCFQGMKRDTDYIIIDDVKNLSTLKDFFNQEILIVHRKTKSPIRMLRPQAIVILMGIPSIEAINTLLKTILTPTQMYAIIELKAMYSSSDILLF